MTLPGTVCRSEPGIRAVIGPRREWATDVGLVRAEGEDQDRPGGQDRGDAQGQGAGDHLRLAAEVAGGVGRG